MDIPFVSIGRILKSYGTTGKVRVQIFNNYKDFFKAGSYYFIEIDGIKVPYYLSKIESGHKLLCSFLFVETLDHAKLISGQRMYIKAEELPPEINKYVDAEKEDLEKLIGYTAIGNENEVIGVITNVKAFPGQNMAFIDRGEKQQEILIPVVEEFVVKTDHKKKRILFDLPDGLI